MTVKQLEKAFVHNALKIIKIEPLLIEKCVFYGRKKGVFKHKLVHP